MGMLWQQPVPKRVWYHNKHERHNKHKMEIKNKKINYFDTKLKVKKEKLEKERKKKM
jgi:hypothetical protein